LRARDADWFAAHFGSWGQRVRELIHGIDDREVHSDGGAKSIGHEETFGVDVIEKDHLRYTLLEHAEAVGARLRRQAYFAGGVTVKIRTGDFKTVTRSGLLTVPADTTAALFAAAVGLFETWASDHFQPVRLIGLTAQHLSREAQLDLFAYANTERQQKVDRTVDAINARFGKAGIARGADKPTRRQK